VLSQGPLLLLLLLLLRLVQAKPWEGQNTMLEVHCTPRLVLMQLATLVLLVAALGCNAAWA
jgi:hypothetical protein